MGDGTVKYPYYKTNGVPEFRGIRNKRSVVNRELKERAKKKNEDRIRGRGLTAGDFYEDEGNSNG